MILFSRDLKNELLLAVFSDMIAGRLATVSGVGSRDPNGRGVALPLACTCEDTHTHTSRVSSTQVFGNRFAYHTVYVCVCVSGSREMFAHANLVRKYTRVRLSHVKEHNI